jgi:UDP:flavonoid glycosyltransferase YjiC (YdhE family)
MARTVIFFCGNENSSDVEGKVALLCSPVATGHLNPLLGVARALTHRGWSVTIAISGDPNEPASKHTDAVSEHTKIDL